MTTEQEAQLPSLSVRFARKCNASDSVSSARSSETGGPGHQPTSLVATGGHWWSAAMPHLQLSLDPSKSHLLGLAEELKQLRLSQDLIPRSDTTGIIPAKPNKKCL